MLWRQWSPNWAFDNENFDPTALSFDNPDFVDVVIHSYRFGFGLAPGDPTLSDLEERLAQKPAIEVPTITIDGTQDPLKPKGKADQSIMFAARHEHRAVGCGHNLPWEVSDDFADAVITVRSWAEGGKLML